MKGEPSFVCLDFAAGSEDKARFKKSYVEEAITQGKSYSIQDILYGEGYFNVKVIPLGANLCILESPLEGVVEAMLKVYMSWLDESSEVVRRWKSTEVDQERITWVKIFVLPCLA